MTFVKLSFYTLAVFHLLLQDVSCERITLSLVGGSSPNEGEVLVKRGSDWGVVCDDGWSVKAGNVVCKQLGYNRVKRVTAYNTFKTGNKYKVFLDDVRCRGFELNLGECRHREWMRTDCHSGEAAGVICDDGKAPTTTKPPQTRRPIDLYFERLANLNPQFRRIRQQKLNRQRVTTTPDAPATTHQQPSTVDRRWRWTRTTKQIQTTAMTPATTMTVTTTSTSKPPTTPRPLADQWPFGRQSIEISQQEIDDAERMMTQLRKDSHNIRPTARVTDVQIVGGRNPREGYVQITMSDGKTGALCSDNWDIFGAMVVCQEAIGLFAGRSILSDFFKGGDEEKILYEARCDGQERSLADCDLRVTDRHGAKCSQRNNVAGVICTKVLPDLLPNITALRSSITIEDRLMGHMTCAIEENCVASTAYQMKEKYSRTWKSLVRRLLRFSSSIYNNGTGGFRPNQHRSSWEWHTCHMHYHSMSTFSTYDILDAKGNRVAEGHKASFCLEDVQCDSGIKPKYKCRGFGHQGISVGCSDVYKHDIDCQWIDVTDLKPGAYIFKLNVNPDLYVPELSFDNNAVMCELSFTGYSAKLNECTLARG